MTMPSDEDLYFMFMAEYQRVAKSPDMDAAFDADYDEAVQTCDRAGVAAVKRAIIEGLAREAEEPDGHIVQYLGWTNSDDIADWLRSHLPSDS